MMIRDWSDLAKPPFAAAEASRWIAILPLGATEQHGPHLPLETDTLIGEAYLARVRAMAPEQLRVAVLPIQPIGISTEHIDFAGTQTIAPDKALRDWMAIGESVARAGVPKLVIVTSHGGNSAMMSVVAQELRARHKLLVVSTSWSRFGTPPGLFSDHELRHGIHAGAVETSIMLAAWPDRVRRDQISSFEPRSVAMDRDFRWLNAHRPTPFAWQMQDLHESGAAGDATAGTAEKGEALLGYGAAAFCDLLTEIDRFSLLNSHK
jgi:creatinine amidohydrolase